MYLPEKKTKSFLRLCDAVASMIWALNQAPGLPLAFDQVECFERESQPRFACEWTVVTDYILHTGICG